MKGQPTYKENQDNAKNAWCRLVEKAFAKYYGHYRDVKEMKGMSSIFVRVQVLNFKVIEIRIRRKQQMHWKHSQEENLKNIRSGSLNSADYFTQDLKILKVHEF